MRPCARGAFTLVELLVAVTIIVILSTLILFGMSGVQKLAKVQRAKAQVSRLHELIAEKWESLDSRRVPSVNLGYYYASTTPLQAHPWWDQLWRNDWGRPATASVAETTAFDRLRKLRELARIEMPERASDIFFFRASQPTQVRQPDLWPAIPADLRYFYSFVCNHARSWQNPAASDYWANQYASAECLYMIVSRMEVGEASTLEFFNEKEIGDKDRDGMPELWDPWGNPILFLRWPTGFVPSPLQPTANPLESNDPYDLADVDGGAYFYFSLIVSCGPDGEPDLAMKVNGSGGDQINYSLPADANNNNPFQVFGSSPSWRVGQVYDTNGDGTDNSIDNIHNHLIETTTR